jgi:4-amino-4-deoxy-L-arabinose transferase-like glycosyltransferase
LDETSHLKKIIPRLLFLLTLGLGAYFRIYFLYHQVGHPYEPDFGGDPCQHYNIAYNLALGNGPKTDFIFSYWFRHPTLPAMTDVYPPGAHLVMASFMKLLGVNFFTARLASLTLGILSLVLVFLICRRWLNFIPSLAAMLFLALNPTHIEHSAVVMTPVISMFFYLLFLYLISKKQLSLTTCFFSGVVLGYAQLNQGLAPAVFASLLLVILFYLRKMPNKKDPIKKIVIGISGYFLVLLPWAIVTWKYFGTPLYSNLSFYPVSDDWGQMLYSETPPTLRGFFSHHTFWELITRYFKWSGKFFIEWKQTTLPHIGYRIASFCKYLLLFTLGIGLFCRSLSPPKRISLLLIFLSTALLTILGSSGMGGWLAPRHYLFHVGLTSLFFGLGISFLGEKYRKTTLCILVLIMYLSINTTLRWVKSSDPNFWKLTSPSLMKMGEWIDTKLPKEAKIFYHMTPQDLWCFSHRQVVTDPSLSGGSLYRDRTLKEMKYYKVDYLLLDKSKDVYDRTHLFDLLKVEEYFPGVKLSLLKVIDQKLFLYEISEKR